MLKKSDGFGKRPFRIGLLIFPAFNSLAVNAFIDPFRIANYLQGNPNYKWDYLSLNGEETTASNGFTVAKCPAFYEFEGGLDCLVINASWTPEKFQERPLQKWLRQLDDHHVQLIGLDTGAFVLAFAGLLEGYKATVHYEHLASFDELFPDVHAEQSFFVIDRNRVSCSGGVAATDLALELIRRHHGMTLANSVAKYIFKSRIRGENEQQLSTTEEPIGQEMPEIIQEALLLIEQNVEKPLTIPELALKTGMSQRQLERLFQKYLGVTPYRFYLNIRLHRARAFLTQTELSISEIAVACGFKSAEHFSRTYKKQFGLPPHQDRIAGRIPFEFRPFPSYLGN